MAQTMAGRSVGKRIFAVVEPVSWAATVELSHGLVNWMFRGQASADWPLATTLERKAEQSNCAADQIRGRERWILRNFQRRMHHYLPNTPTDEGGLDRLARLQHHGGPTRLLDWTYSFYIAAYFAMESATTDAAVWAVNVLGLDVAVRERLGSCVKATVPALLLKRNGEIAEKILAQRESSPMVLHVEPYALSERLSIQQGTFLFKADVQSSFMRNFAATWNVDPLRFTEPQKSIEPDDVVGAFGGFQVLKILLPRSRHTSALNDLWKMNIHAGTLFPGLDGFARSLQHHLRYHGPGEIHERIY